MGFVRCMNAEDDKLLRKHAAYEVVTTEEVDSKSYYVLFHNDDRRDKMKRLKSRFEPYKVQVGDKLRVDLGTTGFQGLVLQVDHDPILAPKLQLKVRNMGNGAEEWVAVHPNDLIPVTAHVPDLVQVNQNEARSRVDTEKTLLELLMDDSRKKQGELIAMQAHVDQHGVPPQKPVPPPQSKVVASDNGPQREICALRASIKSGEENLTAQKKRLAQLVKEGHGL